MCEAEDTADNNKCVFYHLSKLLLLRMISSYGLFRSAALQAHFAGCMKLIICLNRILFTRHFHHFIGAREPYGLGR